MSPPDLAGERPAMFFESDLTAAAEACAIQLEDHGLDPDAQRELAEEIAAAIRKYFKETSDVS